MIFRKKYSQPMPPWLKWGLVGLLVIALMRGALNPNSMQKQNWNMLSMETYKSRLLPGYGRLQITDIKLGEGEGAVCGQDVKIQLRALSLQQNQPPGEEQTKAFRLGSADMPAALQEGILGMKPGGERELGIPAERADPPGKPQFFSVALINNEPKLPVVAPDAMPLRTLDTRVGPLKTVRCGEEVHMNVNLWDADGHKLFGTAETLVATLGETPLPVGLTQGLLGMQRGGTRTILIPSALQHPLREGDTPAISLPADYNHVLIADIELLP